MLVTDRRRLAPHARTLRDELIALEAQLDDALESLVDVIQIRERDVPAGLLVTLARRIASRAASSRVLVNDRADVVAAAEAHGVHLRADSVPATRVRATHERWTIGRSLHEGDDVAAVAEGADYLLFGAVFPTVSKPGVAAAGLRGLERAAAASPIPTVAIGGLTPRHAAACAAAGAAGVAAIGLFLPPGQAPDALGVREATRQLRAAFGKP